MGTRSTYIFSNENLQLNVYKFQFVWNYLAARWGAISHTLYYNRRNNSIQRQQSTILSTRDFYFFSQTNLKRRYMSFTILNDGHL